MKKLNPQFLALCMIVFLSYQTKAFQNKNSTKSLSTITEKNSYCIPTVQKYTRNWKNSFALGEKNISISTGNGYVEDLETVFSTTRGDTESILLKSSDRYMYWIIWIDLNQDNVFSENEKIVTRRATNFDYFDMKLTKDFITVAIPTSTKLGKTRIRLMSSTKKNVTSCQNEVIGYVVDYSINILEYSDPGNEPIKKTFQPITNLEAKNATDNSIDLSWKHSVNQNEIEGYKIYVNNQLFGNTKINSYKLKGLTPSHNYTISVETWGYNRLTKHPIVISSERRNVKAKTTNNDKYCLLKFKNPYKNHKGILDLAGKTYYYNQTIPHVYDIENVLDIKKETSQRIFFRSNVGGWGLRIHLWVDLNQDGVFSTDEKIVSELTKYIFLSDKPNYFLSSFSLPASTKTGQTRARVMLNNLENPSPCGEIIAGFARDYIFNIINNLDATKKITVNVYPNPVNEVIKITPTKPFTKNVEYSILNNQGSIIRNSTPLINNKINVENLKPGTYFLRVNDNSNSFTKRIIK